MSTVGISFGSATSGQGFDVAATVTAILANEQAIETPYKAQISTIQAQNAALSTLGTGLSSLSAALQTITDYNGVLAAKQGSSSATNLLTLTSASSTAIAGSHTIEIKSLASTSSVYSDSVTNANDTLSGSVTLAIGSGASKTITIDSSDNTLHGLARAINDGSYGVSASVITDSSGSRLSLVSAVSGAGGQIALTSNLNDQTTSAAIAFSVGQQGADASLTVDGLATGSASNTVTNVIPGVTFQLLASSPGTQVQVQVTNDNKAIETAVASLVTAYNAVLSAAGAQEGKDANGNAQPLFGTPTLSLLQTQLISGLRGGGATGSIGSIEQLGISITPTGALSFDQSVLDAKLNSNFSDVTGFLQATGGFGQTFTTALNGLSSSNPTGALYLAAAQNKANETQLTADIAKEDALLTTQRATLTKELNLANQELQSIPSQLNNVNELYNAITGYTQTTN